MQVDLTRVKGTIYIVYDYSRTKHKEVLMATLQEADVLAGKPVSAKVRREVLVNRATGRQG